jgi:predicted metal-dependent enzyme (double-stranded beta helix superfamily)
MTSTLHIDTLISNIKKEFATKPDPSQSVRALLEDYVSSGYDDWRQYAFFNPHKYCRNLLEFNEDFELIVLCWEPNQESPIHNHSVCPFSSCIEVRMF